MAVQDALQIKEMKDVDIEIDTKLPLLDYQKVGALFMLSVKKCFNLDDPGLGKTIQTLGYLKLLQRLEKRSNIKALIVVIPTILYQWESEVKKFTNLLPVVVDGGKKARETIYRNFAKGNQNILLINYTKILYDWDIIRELKFDTVVFDEASCLKDRTSKIHQYFGWLTRSVKRVVMLTATPVSNNLEEFYNLFDLFHEKFLPEYQEFRDNFLETKPERVRKNGRTFTIQRVIGSKLHMIPVFRQMIEPYFIRRLNTDVGTFSQLKMNIHKYPIFMTTEQKQICSDLKTEHFRSDDSQALKVYSDFVKVACAPQIYAPVYSNVSPKAIEAIKLIKSTNKKIVLFAKFIEFHEILQDYLRLAGIPFVSITGKQSPKEKDKNKELFNSDPSVQIILLTGAGKFGLNLQVTNQIIFVDLPYTPTDVFQYIGRIFRTGQTEDVDVHFLYHEESLEENLFSVLERRQQEIDILFEQDKASIFHIDSKDSDKVDVRKSFLSYNYAGGETYDKNLTAEVGQMIPEKRQLSVKSSSEFDESDDGGEVFHSIDIISL